MPTGFYPRRGVAERFWEKVLKGDGCWEWQGGRANRGYGVFGIANRLHGAHRVAWALTNGPVPPGRWVLHRCDNPPCVRPDHLFLGDRAVNVQDMHAKHRWHLANGKLTREQAQEIRRMATETAMTQREIAQLCGVSQSAVSRIKTGDAWT
jgi:hypothetical protein